MTPDQPASDTSDAEIASHAVTAPDSGPSQRWVAIPQSLLTASDLPPSFRVAAMLALTATSETGELLLSIDTLARRYGVAPSEFVGMLERLEELRVIHLARDEFAGIAGVRYGAKARRRTPKPTEGATDTPEAVLGATGELFDVSAFDEGEPGDRFVVEGGDGRPWHVQLAEVWTREIGHIHVGRIGKALKPAFKLAPNVDTWVKVVDFYAHEAKMQKRLAFASPERLAGFASVYLALYDDAQPEARLAILSDPDWKAPV